MLFGLDKDELSAYSALATAIIALLALTIAYIQMCVNKKEARFAVAKGIYKDYLTLAFDNPEFSSASYPLNAPRLQTFSFDDDKYERYEFFVSYLLFAAEEILVLTKNSQAWRATLSDQLRYHALYLDTQDFPEHHYSSDLLTLREEAITAYKESKEGN
ncbi:TPA: hypothetical protein ACSP0D_002958 [Aeromonas veronii]